ncbi:hypothetical protein LLB_2936 [Legionella longbeachae D-4968]|nr:hypothetical protein LLB_2936 [Legionella longbeachae D-4968]
MHHILSIPILIIKNFAHLVLKYTYRVLIWSKNASVKKAIR